MSPMTAKPSLYKGDARIGNLDQGSLRPWEERESPPGKGGTLETTKVKIQTKEVQECL